MSSLAPAFLALLLVAPPAPASSPSPTKLSEAAEWLRGYVRFDTTNPPGGEAAAVAYLARILHRNGIATQTFVAPGGRASLYARLEGSRDGGGLLLHHHVDVVAPGAGWTVPPFEGLVRDGALWGRGAIDVKSLGIAHLATLVALRREGIRPERDIAFLAVADEESGGGSGTAWLWQHHPEIFKGIGAVYGEGGTNRAPRGAVEWWGLEVAQKRPLWLRATAHGRAGHASGLNPHSAMHKLVRALDRALEMPPRWHVSPAARTFFGALAPYEPPGHRERFADLDSWVGPDGPRQAMLPGIPNYFLDTLQVTVIEGGERINVIPAKASALLDVRLLPDTDSDLYLSRLREALGREIDIEVLVTSPPAEAAPVDHHAYAAAAEILGSEAPVVPAFIAGFTDSRHFRERGIATYGLSPFVLEGDVLRGIHGADERIPLAELDRGVERMRRIVARYAGLDR